MWNVKNRIASSLRNAPRNDKTRVEGTGYFLLLLRHCKKLPVPLALLLMLATSAHAGLELKRSDALGPTDGLVGYWPFDGPDMSGTTVYDRSGQGNNGTMVNSPLRIEGKAGQALSFGGTNYINVGNPASLRITGDASFSAWVYMRSFNTGGTDDDFISKSAGGTNIAWQFKGTQDCGPQTIALLVSSDGTLNTDGQRCGATTLSLNRWYHAAGVFNASSQTIDVYLNGVLDNGTLQGTVPSSIFDSSNNVTIGSRSGGHNLNGIIDEPRVYNRALTAAEIRTLYNAGRGVVTAALQEDNLANGLVGYWPFNGPDISGTTAYDRSGNGYNGTITGAALTIGKIGQGLNFDGDEDYIDLPGSLPSMSDFTVSTWAKLNANAPLNPNSRNAILDMDDTNGDTRLMLDPTGSYFAINNGIGGNFDEPLIDTWVHVAIVRSGTTARSYRNAVLMDTWATDAGSVDFGGAVIGDQWEYDFNGVMDEFRIYNRALSVSEIQALYNQGAPLVQASQEAQLANGLVGYWPMNGPDVVGNVAYDRSGQGHNGTIVNSPLKIEGKVGQGMRFDGSDRYVDIPPPGINFSNGYTASLWIKTNNINGAPITAFSGGYYGIEYYGWGGNLSEWWGYNTDWAYVNAGMRDDNQWHMYTCTWDLNYMTSYRDDAQVQQKFYQNLSIGDSRIQIGKDTRGGGYFSGSIDEVRVYNRALSAKEVKRLYNLGR